ncbi:MAG: sugar ABC transporter permease [Catenulispora sp. 13_1_20CM_3_70_7]|nr:MAG: sugar ABC transporter permease [Catenulispora sp. 13_1_20CM_3_70_7]
MRAGRGRREREVTRLLPLPLQAFVVAALLLLVLAPVAYVFLASVNSDLAVARGGFLPEHVDLGNYLRIWSTVDLGGGLVNSLLVAGTVAAVCALVSVGSAYVLVRFGFRGRVSILRGLLALQSIPGTLLLLPVFVLFASAATLLGIPVIGTRWALFLTYLTFALPFSTWVMVTYLRGLPRELDEAARIDGASSWRVLTRIILPLSRPGVVVAGIFAFLLGWNDVLFASVLTNPDTRTAAVALQVFGATQEGGAIPVYGQLMAAALVCAVPVVVLYLVFQRYLVGGLTTGGVK